MQMTNNDRIAVYKTQRPSTRFTARQLRRLYKKYWRDVNNGTRVIRPAIRHTV
jgi:hypothetical protein